MSARAAILSTLLVFVTAGVSAQVLSVTTAPGYPVVRIDAASGAILPLFPTNVTSAHPGLNAYDSVGHQLFFLTGTIGSQQLVVANLTTGSVNLLPIADASAYVFFEYDPASGRIIALTNAPGFPLVAIDPVTGVVETLLTTNVTSAHPGLSAFDPTERRLHFLTGFIGSQSLVTVDLDTAAITSVPIPRTDAYVFFEYDPVTERIVSVADGAGFPLLSIDPATGVVQTLFLTNVTSAHPGLSVIDISTQRLFFLTGSVGSQELVTVDIPTGSVSSVSIAMSPAVFVFFEGDFSNAESIPALSTAVLLILTAIIAGFGVSLIGTR